MTPSGSGRTDLRKSIPPPTPETVFPPNLKHVYFEHGKDHPFRPRSRKFELVNAWWLAESSLLAYADPGFATPAFKQAGFTSVKFLNTTGSTQCYVASNDAFAIVAVRGTQVLKRGSSVSWRDVLQDVVADGRFFLVDSGQGGFVHEGFAAEIAACWAPLAGYLDELRKSRGEDRKIWFTGHSLGAAIATLAADRDGGGQGLYTFGSPLVGDASFRDDFHVKTYRIVHHRDIVTRVPPIGPHKADKTRVGRYEHVGSLRYIDGSDELIDDPSTQQVTALRAGRFEALVNAAFELRLGALWEIATDDLNDHAPLYYALKMWNAYVSDL